MPRNGVLHGFLFALFSFSFLAAPQAQNLQASPIIGIVGQPPLHAAEAACDGEICEYIAASYIKYIEARGGRVVPISYYASEAEAERLFARVNGLLFPGGSAMINGVYRTLLDLAIAANDAGDVFPIWGTCLGFEFLVELAGGELDFDYTTTNMTLPLKYTEAAKTSRLFKNMNGGLMDMLADPKTTSAFNYHTKGIDAAHWGKYPDLEDTFEILATSVDPGTGREFVAAMEAKQYPFYGVQFHPEKNVFEHGKYPDGSPYEAIVHTNEAMAASLYFSGFFLDVARQNTHAFPSQAEEDAILIWNYKVFTNLTPEFVQLYVDNFRLEEPEPEPAPAVATQDFW